MGRIDDALRRAAESAAEDAPANVDAATNAGPSDDIEALAREAFPIEIEEHRHVLRPMPTPPAAHTPTPITAPPRSPQPFPEASTTRRGPRDESAARGPSSNLPQRASTFDRIDTSLVGKIVVDAEIAPASREQYRRMAATLHHAQASHGLKVVMVTSALMGEGKTLTSSNLALTLSESYKKSVLLIDGDLRRPSLHTLFNIDSSPGLSEGLIAGDDQRLAVRQVSQRLGVLTAGRPSADPIAGLTSSRMRRVIEEARDAFDWVIIDTPPVAVLPDANLLATMADGVILVVKAGSTPWDLAQRAVQTIGKERVLGVVLNRSSEPSHESSYGYYDYYAAPPAEVPPSP
jgi:capsular exopolysaccharide synthesis family protein